MFCRMQFAPEMEIIPEGQREDTAAVRKDS